MRTRLLQTWESLRTSYWFIPALMAVAAVVLAYVLLRVDRATDWSGGGWVYSGSADGARALLATVAGSSVTVAGVVFSVVIVALTLASGQFGPRLLRNFMRDLGNQLTLGTFIATDLYCFLVLRTVRSDGEAGGGFVPQIAITAAMAMAVASVGVLIYFIHHAATSIMAENVIGAVADDLNVAIDDLFPGDVGRPVDAAQISGGEWPVPPDFGDRAAPVLVPHDGYVQIVDGDALIEAASRADVIVHLIHRPGRFVIKGLTLARVYPPERAGKALAESVQDAFGIGPLRTTAQDLEFAVDQLVEVAVRSLSPAVNDPFTAMACVDVLAAALCRLARRDTPSPFRADGAGRLRVIVHTSTFSDVVEAAFNQIRQYARGSVAVTIRLLEAIASIAQAAHDPEQRAVLLRHAQMVHRQARQAIAEPQDLHDVEQRYTELAALLGADPARTGNGAGVVLVHP